MSPLTRCLRSDGKIPGSESYFSFMEFIRKTALKGFHFVLDSEATHRTFSSKLLPINSKWYFYSIPLSSAFLYVVNLRWGTLFVQGYCTKQVCLSPFTKPLICSGKCKAGRWIRKEKQNLHKHTPVHSIIACTRWQYMVTKSDESRWFGLWEKVTIKLAKMYKCSWRWLVGIELIYRIWSRRGWDTWVF